MSLGRFSGIQSPASSGPKYKRSAVALSSLVATGGTIYTSGSTKIHVFTTSGTFTVTSGATTTAKLVVVGGGACGPGNGGNYTPGGSGAGAVTTFTNISLSAGTYAVTVGAGGTTSISSIPRTGNPGTASSFTASYTAATGTGGAYGTGGDCGNGNTGYHGNSGGGGGAGASVASGMNGGAGVLVSELVGYAGVSLNGRFGGGGAGYNGAWGTASDGGGAGAAATANTGGGGSPLAYNTGSTGFAGGSGIVAVIY